MQLYSYWRSTTSYRVRIALNLKGLDYEIRPIHLVKGEQKGDDYAALNPQKGVPTLVVGDQVLTQSMAILAWLDETHPEPPLATGTPMERARIWAAAMGIATDIHPVNNLRVIGRLKAYGLGQDDALDWMRHWMAEGFSAYQALTRDTPFSFGESPTVADICLVAQLYNAHRWGLDLSPFTRLTEIEARCLDLPAFDRARPENQPDAD